VASMREQNLDTPDIVQLMHDASAEGRRASERLVDHYSRLIRASTAEFKRASQLRGTSASAGSKRATRRSASCRAKGELRQGCS
jgi:hypothetical protein